MHISILFILFNLLKPTHIAVIGDTQANPKIFRSMIKEMNRGPANILIHLGDQVGHGSIKKYKRFRNSLRNLKLRFYLVPGNHDIQGITRSIWMRRWSKKYTWQAITCFPYRCLLMDTASSQPPEEQISWFQKQFNRYNNFLLFMHRPFPIPFRSWPDDYDCMNPIPCTKHNWELWKTFLKNKQKIKAIFHGHYHSYRKYQIQGIPVFCSGGGGGKLSKRYGNFYHWLLVKLDPFEIKIIKK